MIMMPTKAPAPASLALSSPAMTVLYGVWLEVNRPKGHKALALIRKGVLDSPGRHGARLGTG